MFVSVKTLLAEKDKQVELLKEENKYLKKLVYAYMYPQIPDQEKEKDMILAGGLTEMNFDKLSEDKKKELKLAEEEANKLLTGELMEIY